MGCRSAELYNILICGILRIWERKNVRILVDIFIFYLFSVTELSFKFVFPLCFVQKPASCILWWRLVILVLRNILHFLKLLCYNTMTAYFWLFFLIHLYTFSDFLFYLHFLYFQFVLGKLMHEYCGLTGFLLLALWEKEGKGAVGGDLTKEE